MSLTEEQKAFRLRKLRTCFASHDIDKDGYITIDDFKEGAKRCIEYGKLKEEKAKETTKEWLDLANSLGVKEGDKISQDQFLASAMTYCDNPESQEFTKRFKEVKFDVVDADDDGVISLEEFQLYFKCVGIDESHAKASFDGIDTDRDGKITKEEFVAASIEFFFGFDKTSGATLFYGPLVD